MALTEQLELQLLSDEHQLAMTDSGENPGIDEIYQESPVASTPGVQTVENNPQTAPTGQSETTNGTGANHKPRMRWTPELHKCFVEAVSKLGGAESMFYGDLQLLLLSIMSEPLVAKA